MADESDTSPRRASKGIVVSSSGMDGFYLDLPSEDEIVYVGSRRCSARIISQSVQQTLRQIRKDQHEARVSQLLDRNATNYRRQRLCECITMIVFLLSFTCFSLYVVFAYGFHFSNGNPFNLVLESPRTIIRREGDVIDLLCQADTYWEWCRWIHTDRYCDFEWVSTLSGVEIISCEFPEGKVELIGNYEAFECGIRVHNLEIKDRGVWHCEVEKYYFGFSRRYGELETSMINLVIKESKNSSIPTLSDSLSVTEAPPTTELTPTSTHVDGATKNTTQNPASDFQDYQQQFFFLKLFVLGGVGLVLSTLVGMFAAYFMYLWRTWDNGKREAILGPGSALPPSNNDEFDKQEKSKIDLSKCSNDDPPEISQAAVVGGRRKSVSFAVCTLDEDTMSFNIERKSVLIGNDPNGQNSHPLFRPSSPLLVHMAKKLKSVTQVKPKGKSFFPDRKISIQASARNLPPEVIEIYNERGQLVSEAKMSEDISETEM